MKLNVDCLRSILLSVEDKSFGKTMSIDDLQELLPSYSNDDLCYCVLKLHEAGFLNVNLVTMGQSINPGIKSIGELTITGHEFLENIRPENVWEKKPNIQRKR